MMATPTVQEIIEAALAKAAEMNSQETEGEWLEVVTVESAPYIKEWDVAECWHWDEWPDRETHFPNTTRQDVGIDAVARRRSDGKHIAIQCKSRQLDDEGRGDSIKSNEVAKFAAASASDVWAERWIVTNGANPLASGAAQSASMHTEPLKLVNITSDLQQQRQANAAAEESDQGLPDADGNRRVRENFDRSTRDNAESIPILESKGAEGQKTIQSTPDGHWVSKKGRERQAKHYLEWSSHLLITAGQDNSTARLTATASETKYLGQTWFPVVGLSPDEAKAVAVFVNSTPGRLQIMRVPGKKLQFPSYSPRATNNLKVPDIKDDRIRKTLVDCWERTKDMVVPQFRDGECEVRRLWDQAVAEAMGWDAAELKRLRLLLHREPHVCGLGYGQYADEVEVDPAVRERFTELADRWYMETCLMSDSDRAAAHPDHMEIISMGEPVVPLILERMQDGRGHWDYALGNITGANPVKRADWGNIAAIHASWLEWGEANGYI